MTTFKNPQVILTLIISFFLSLFIAQSVITMVNIPFYDFDEAHRAENAKRMKEYGSFFVPLTGSSQDRVQHLKVPLRENHNFHLYYHLERPPLIYDLMILSTSLFGSVEWSYRLPSFLLGMLTLAAVLFFATRDKPQSFFAIFIGTVCLITSSDLWLSSQYAQMDTGITFFLTLSLLTLIYFCQNKKTYLIYLAGVFFGLGLLSKLQPAVIFIFPILALLFLKKINLADLLRFIIGSLIVFLPWVIYLSLKFGIKDVIQIMPGFAINSASIDDIHHQAPFFWYIRWWWESLRPGWTIFLALFILDFSKRQFSFQKLILLSFIFGGLISFSIPINKLWWYVVPILPAICYYIFLSTRDYLEENLGRLNNLSVVIILASLPMFLQTSNTISMIYGIILTAVSYFILKTEGAIINRKFISDKKLFILSLIIALIAFYLHFPQIIPYHRNTKGVSLYYKDLPGKKCLWTGDMPQEAVLFYSNAGEVHLLKEDSALFTGCPNNYLITPQNYREGKLLLRQGNIRLYQLSEDYRKLSR